MDDEEEDMSQPISPLWGTPLRDLKFEDRAAQTAAGQAIVAASSSQSHNDHILGFNAMDCRPHRLPHPRFSGNSAFLSHFPAPFAPMEDRGQRPVEEEEGRGEEDHRVAERPEAAVSIEAQIGRKLREIGDQFHQDHVELFLRHQRDQPPLWMRLTAVFFRFLFPREALVPQLRAEQR